ncbi:hypothetical protein CPB86DRAFT_791454 [Serendipita vermifera]|nr:hypothetical protein CPB86DRAFT_791454 [Serendipita vermifera]
MSLRSLLVAAFAVTVAISFWNRAAMSNPSEQTPSDSLSKDVQQSSDSSGAAVTDPQGAVRAEEPPVVEHVDGEGAESGAAPKPKRPFPLPTREQIIQAQHDNTGKYKLPIMPHPKE